MATISFYQSFVVDRRGIFNSSLCSIQSRLFTVTYTASYSLSGVVSTTPRVMYNVTYGRVSTFVSVHAASSLLDRVSVECPPLNNGSAWGVGASVYASFMDCAPLQLASQSSVSTLYAIAGVETSISGSRVLYSTDSRLSRVDLPPVSSAVALPSLSVRPAYQYTLRTGPCVLVSYLEMNGQSVFMQSSWSVTGLDGFGSSSISYFSSSTCSGSSILVSVLSSVNFGLLQSHPSSTEEQAHDRRIPP